MGFFCNSKFEKLEIRLNALLRSKDDVPKCAWSMLTEMGDEAKDYEDLNIAINLRDRVHSRMMEQGRRPIPDFVTSKIYKEK